MELPSKLEDAIFLLTLSEQSGQFKESSALALKLLTSGEFASPDERGAILTSLRAYSTKLRSSWRILKQMELVESEMNASTMAMQARKYREEVVGKELTLLCESVIRIVDKKAVPKGEATCDAKLVLADMARYLAEIDPSLNAVAESHYKAALSVTQELSGPHPKFLTVMLNYAVFLFENKKDTKLAVQMAKEALQKLSDTSPTVNAKTPLIAAALKYNLRVWEESA